jgi:hypothetical protein
VHYPNVPPQSSDHIGQKQCYSEKVLLLLYPLVVYVKQKRSFYERTIVNIVIEFFLDHAGFLQKVVGATCFM